ncbi:MAG: UpxY family transcription antiterminator [Calditrichaeota bacterium]|nr:MAG: UpxY family transcription antiterminator [Calditrichota bacterium]
MTNSLPNEKIWYAITVKSRHDAKVYQRLIDKNIECLYATYTAIRQWKDRKKKVEMPLFPGYVFVKINLWKERVSVLETYGVSRFVQLSNEPEKISEQDIQLIQGSQNNEALNPQPEKFQDYKIGSEVKILDGVFKGHKGSVVENIESKRFIIRIDSLMQAFSINVEGFSLKMEKNGANN